jgi:hypothetical protein
LDSLTDTLAADPLSLSAAAFDAVDDAIAAAHASVTSAEALREHLTERLAAGRALLDALPALLGEARAARDLAAVKIAGTVAAPATPVPGGTRGRAVSAAVSRPAAIARADAPRAADRLPTDGELRALGSELAALDALAAAGQWRVLAARRPSWSAGVHAVTDQAAAVRDRCRADLARRDELRGRLGAYQAKARAYGLAEDAELSRLADLAHGTLSVAPCDLTAAGQQVSDYAAAVRAATATSTPGAGRTPGPC